MIYSRSSSLFIEAQTVLPGGVNSPVRAFKSVGGHPIFIKKAKGAYLFDEDGNQFIDYINSWGPAILGHAHPEVTQAIIEQANNGTSFGTPTELETEIAKLVVESVPNIDKIRFVNSGTEACMSAIRLARGFTKRNKIIKFAGCYHGHADAFLIEAGSGAATFGLPNSPGVTPGTAQDTLLANYNDLGQVKSIFEQNKDEIAAIILEPVAGNMGCVPPEMGFLEGLRALCDQHNSLLIFDEVMTGFRLSLGGAQQLFDVKADLVTFGKVIGGGMPVGAFAGRQEIMDYLAPQGPVYQAGTLSGNPLAMRAGYTILKILKDNPSLFEQLEKTTDYLNEEIGKILNEKEVDYQINQVGSMMSVFFTDQAVLDFESAKSTNIQMFNQFFHHMLDNGIYLAPSAFETWFISSSIQQEEIEKTLEGFRKFEFN